MLEHYSVENFKSFKKRTEFDFMVDETYSTLRESNTADGILKGGLFVGGNASGKTNAVQAIKFLLDALFYNEAINWKRFFCLFSASYNLDLNYRFRIDGHTIFYRLCYQKRKSSLKEELWLDKKVLLKRDGPNAESELSERKNFDNIPKQSVFLRDIWFNTGFRNHEVLQKWFSFLQNSVFYNSLTRGGWLYNDEIPGDIDEYLSVNGVQGEQFLNRFLDECGFPYRLRYNRAEAEKIARNYRNSRYAGLYLLRDEIKLKQGIPVGYESMGNQVLLSILLPYLYVVGHGGMLIIDEFSSGLHNDLERLLIQYFMRRSGNAQIFLVSHSTNLLSSGLFRPDQLYAVNFDENGSNVVRFSEREPRVSQNLEKMYLSGMFSGVPHYRDASEWGRDDV